MPKHQFHRNSKIGQYELSAVELRHWSDGRKDKELDRTNDQDNSEFHELKRDAKEFKVSEILIELEEAGLDLDKLSRRASKNAEEWSRAFEMLAEMNWEYHDRDIRRTHTFPNVERSSDLIPQTRLRRFYQTLRMLNGIEVTTTIAKYLGHKKRFGRLAQIIDESVWHFRRYDNSAEHFHQRDDGVRRVDKYVNEPRNFAKCLQARLRSSRSAAQSIEASDGTNLSYVDYEISPFRKTDGAIMEDGQTGASGGGGLDLLLVDQTEAVRVPVIGEIKAKTDRDLFLALIQALMYTVELSSPKQLERLRKHYDKSFPSLANDAKVDIYLLYEDDPALLDQTRTLAQRLLSYDGELRRIVRQIKFVKVALDVDPANDKYSVKHTVKPERPTDDLGELPVTEGSP